MTVRVRVRPRNNGRRLQVGPAQNNEWQRTGRHLFLNRAAYEARRRRERVQHVTISHFVTQFVLWLLGRGGNDR